MTANGEGRKRPFVPEKLPRYALVRLRQCTFDELLEQAYPTLQPGVSYHRYTGLWLGEDHAITASSYPESEGRFLTRTEHNLRTYATEAR